MHQNNDWYMFANILWENIGRNTYQKIRAGFLGMLIPELFLEVGSGGRQLNSFQFRDKKKQIKLWNKVSETAQWTKALAVKRENLKF